MGATAFPASAIISGTIDQARLGTGSAGFLNHDQTYQEIDLSPYATASELDALTIDVETNTSNIAALDGSITTIQSTLGNKVDFDAYENGSDIDASGWRGALSLATLYQPLDSDLTAIAALTTAAYGRNLLTLANQAALVAAVGAIPISTGVSGLGTGVATLLSGTASGTGGPAGSVSPTFTTPNIGAATGTSLTASGNVVGNRFGFSGTYGAGTYLGWTEGTDGTVTLNINNMFGGGAHSWTAGVFTTAQSLRFGTAANPRSNISSPSDGVITLGVFASGNFGRLCLGGTTSSFPSIKRSGTTTAFRLADDSGDAPITAAAITASGTVTVFANGAASTPAESLTGTWFTGGTSTTTKPQLLVEPTGTTSTEWSTSGTAIGVNAASGFAGNLIDCKLVGSSKFKVDSSGSIFPTNKVVVGSGGISFTFGGLEGYGSISIGSGKLSVTPQGGGSIELTTSTSIIGNLSLSTVGKFIQYKSGTGQRAGNATLVGGTVTVTNTSVTANTVITLSPKTAGGTLGNLTYTLSAGASFTINSDSILDTRVISYELVEVV